MTDTTRRSIRTAVIVAALVAAAALRARAVHLLPPDFDEFDYIPIGYVYAERMAPGRWGEIPEVRRNVEHPALVKLLHGVALKVTGAPEPDFTRLGVGRPLGEEARPAFTVTRALSAAAGSLQVLLVAVVSPVGGLWLAADTYHTKYSAEAMLEAIPGLFALLAVLLFERATRRRAPGEPRDPTRVSVPLLVASAATLGLSAAGKYPYPLVVGLALLPFLVARLRTRPGLLASYLVTSLVVFFAADPILWPDPLGRLTESLGYHWRYQSSEHVVKSALPWWWQLHWLTRPEPASWHPGVFPVPWLDYVILAGALLGLAETLRRRPIWLAWAVVALLFLLAWPTKWPQYTLVARVPLAAMAGLGLEGLWVRARRRLGSSAGHPRGRLPLALLLAAPLLATAPGCHPGGSVQGGSLGFGTPQAVAVQGLPPGVDVMEPFISPDGQTLFFNDSNAPGLDTDLHLATRSSDLGFQYVGKLTGANSAALDAVSSMTADGQLYFISTRSLASDRQTVYRGAYAANALSAVAPVPVTPAPAAGNLIFDAFVQPDGQALWFSEGDYSTGPLHSSRVVLATADGSGGFIRAPDSDSILLTVNLASTLVYAPVVSGNGLEIFFTRLVQSSASIQMATRASTSVPFGPASPIPSITGFAEAPALSPDGKLLYYHWKPSPYDASPFALRVVSRP